MTPTKPKILLWDTETTDLKGDRGHILVLSWKWLGEKKIAHARIDDYKRYSADPTDDTDVLKAF